MQRADINRVRASVHQQCGSSVMIQLDRGRNKVDVQRGGGEYRVDIFADNYMIGTRSFTLKQ